MEPLDIDGAWVFTPKVHLDKRGSFHEWFRRSEFINDLGYCPEFRQGNCSVSRKSVVRGIHFADVPPGQSKYVACVNGAVLDAVVDLRIGSLTFARWRLVRLDDESRRAVYLAEGLGHAFISLSDHATVMYLCSTPYSPARERCVHPLDVTIGIDWPRSADVHLSAKDAAAPGLNEALQAGILPRYSDCIAYTARLRDASARADGIEQQS